jgi:hypothetical protein
MWRQPTGPYTERLQIIPPWAHNPEAIHTPDGEVVVYTLGNGIPLHGPEYRCDITPPPPPVSKPSPSLVFVLKAFESHSTPAACAKNTPPLQSHSHRFLHIGKEYDTHLFSHLYRSTFSACTKHSASHSPPGALCSCPSRWARAAPALPAATTTAALGRCGGRDVLDSPRASHSCARQDSLADNQRYHQGLSCGTYC